MVDVFSLCSCALCQPAQIMSEIRHSNTKHRVSEAHCTKAEYSIVYCNQTCLAAIDMYDAK